MKRRLFLLPMLLVSLYTNAQIIFSEDFDGINGPTAGGAGTYSFPSGWLLANVDNRTPAASVSYVNDAWERREDFQSNVSDSVALSTSWYNPGGQADDWMWTPPIALSGAGLKLSWNAKAFDPAFPDGYEVRIMTVAPTGGTASIGNMVTSSTVLFSVPSENSSWTSRNVSLNAYNGQTVYIGFRNHSNDQFLLAIDDIVVENITSFDGVTSAHGLHEYSLTPLLQSSPVTLSGTVNNIGVQPLTNVVLNASIYNSLNNLVYSASSPSLASLAINTSSNFTIPSWSPAATGTYTIKYYHTQTETDQLPNNDTLTESFIVTDTVYARDDGNPIGQLGVGAGNGGYLGQQYVLTQPARLTSVSIYMNIFYDQFKTGVAVWAYNNGVPTTLIYQSPDTMFTSFTPQWILFNMPPGLILPADTFVVTAVEVDSTIGLGLTNNIFTNGTTWINWPTNPFGTWKHNEQFGAGFAKTYMIRPNLQPPCTLSPPLSISSTGALCAGGGGNVTLNAGAGYAAYAWSTGATTQSIPVSTAGTYTVTVTDTSGCSAISGVAVVVNPPVVPSVPASAAICSGTPVVLDAGPYASFSWSTGATTQTISVLTAGTYTVTVTDSFGCSGSASVVVGTGTYPTPVISGTTSTCNNTPVTLDAGAGYTSYAWSSGATTQTALIAVSGTYTVTVTNAGGCTASTSAAVNIYAPIVPAIPAKDAVCSGTPVVLDAGAYTSFLWSTGATTQAITVSTKGTYTVTATNSFGCTGSAQTVVDTGTTPIVNQPANQAICANHSTAAVTFSGSAVPGTIYNWTNSNTTIGLAASGTDGIPSFTGLNAGNTPVTATITVTPVSQGITPELLYYKFNGTGNTVPNLASSPPSGTTTATIMGGQTQGGSGICDGTLVGAGGFSTTDFVNTGWATSLPASWSIAFKTSNVPLTTNVTYIFGDANAGNFRCFTGGVANPGNWLLRGGLTDVSLAGGANGSTHSCAFVYDAIAGEIKAYLDGVLINTVAQGTVTVSGAGPFKLGGQGTGFCLPSGSLLDEFMVFNRAISASEVQTIAGGCNTAASGCDGIPKTFTITVNPTPVVSITGTTVLCAGSPTTLNAGSGYSSYLWSTGQTTQSIAVSASATFTVTVTNAYSCTGSASVSTFIDPALVLTMGGANVNCNGGNNGAANVSTSGGSGGGLVADTFNFTNSEQLFIVPNGVTSVNITAKGAQGGNGSGTGGLGATTSGTLAVTPGQTLYIYTGGQGNIFNGGAVGGNAGSGNGGGASDIRSGGNGAANRIMVAGGGGGGGGVGCDAVYAGGAGGAGGGGAGAKGTDSPDGGGGFGGTSGTGGAPGLGCSGFLGNPGLNSGVGGAGQTCCCFGNYTVPGGGGGGGGFVVGGGGGGGSAGTISCDGNGKGGGGGGAGGTNFISGAFTATSSFSGIKAGDGQVIISWSTPISTVYTYLWSNGATTDSLSGLSAGTYCVTVTDNIGCSSSGCYTVTEPSVIIASCSGTNVSCNGANDGSAAISASGGIGSAGYTYSWSNGATTNSIGGLSAGTYCATVTDNAGCTASCCYTVTQQLPAVPVISGNTTFCSGSSTTLDAGTYISYLWSTGATTQTISVNTAGTFTVTVTNASGCTGSASVTTTVNPAPVCSITGGNFCQGNSTQLCAATNSGYLWSTGATTQCITVNTGGTYTVTVSAANGCTSSCSKTVFAYQLPTCAITGNNSVCPGSTTQICGSVGSVSTYTYLWNTGATTQCITAGAGTYTVTATSTSGCTSSCSKTVTAYPLPTCSITGGNFCQGSSTQLCAATNSSYLWSTGATSQCITVTTGGTYTVTVTDANGCTNSCSKTVTAYPLPVCSISGGNFCSSSSTQLCTATNSIYLWSTGATTQCITVNTGGTYTVTVSDANGCTNSCSKTVTEYPKPPCSITGSNFCSGSGTQLCTSAIPAGPVNTYLWSTGATTQCITVTTSGTYTVTVTDANGCTNSCSKTVTAYPLPACSIIGGNFCQGSSTQLCAATNSGYLWSTGATTQCITMTTSGTYTVTVTDANGCTNSCSKTITANPLPTCSITGGNFCQGSSTQLCAATNSGYLWSTGATTQCITVTSGGTYTVTVTNANGCTGSCSKTVTAFTLPTCSITGSNFCQGSSTQLCAATNSGYLWSTGATTQCITMTTSGTYTVTVTDANGCTNSCSKTITANPLPTCSITGGNFCQGSSTQLCAASNSGYLWSTGATTQCITVTSGGTYTVTVTNANGCTGSCSKTVTAYPLPACAISGNIAYCEGSTTQLCGTPGMSAYLWNTGATTQCIAAAGGDYTITVTNANGCTSSCSITTHLRLLPVCTITGNNFCNGSSSQLCATTAPAGYVFSYIWTTGATTQCIAVSTGGTYTVTISNQYGCTSSCSKTITRYSLPACPITGTASICPGNSTQWCAPAGLAAYLWSNGATTQCITVSAAGTYTVIVTNTTGCTKSCSKALTVKALPNCTVTGTASVCPGSSTQWCAPAGLAAYLWSNGATTQCITVSTAGTYTVTVTNTGGCTKSCSKTLTVKGVPACSIAGTASICPGGATQWCAPAGLAAYLWSNGATIQCVSVSTAGIYTVTITNAGGCTSSCSKTLTIKTPPSCSINGGNICQGGSTQLCASATAANYLWSTGATTKCISVSAAGIYTVTVTGANGCTNSCSKNVTVSTLPSCVIMWNHAICQGGSAQFCAPAGLSSYLWNTGATSQCVNISTAGDYTVTVSNTSGCTNSCTVKVTVYSNPACSITGNSVVSPGQTTPICAPAGLTYLWNNGATTQCRNVAAGTYTVTVTNANGCTSSCSKTITSAAKMVEPVVIGGDNGAIEASAYPNPFNEKATIEFRNTIASGHVVVELFNLTGSKMAVLFDKDVEQNVTYQTKVQSGNLAEGVYFYRIVSGDNIITGKLILLKQ